MYYTGGKAGIHRKVVLDVAEVREILHHHHSDPMGGHSDIKATLCKVSNFHFWNGMKEDGLEYVSLLCKTAAIEKK